MIVLLSGLLVVAGCCCGRCGKTSPGASKAGTFGDDMAFLNKYGTVLALSDEKGEAQILVSPKYQGRVMTSTAGGIDGASYGWINRELIASGKLDSHFNPVGGEERFWMGPEGGQYSIFFAQGVPFDLEHWFVPPAIDTEPYEVVSQSRDKAAFRRNCTLVNYSGTKFEVTVDREVRLVSADDTWKGLGVAPANDVKVVAFESENRITNNGKEPWNKETGLLSIWILCMFNPSPATTVVAPINPGPESELGKIVTDDYFGKVPAERLAVREKAVFFSADGKYRSKIGFSQKRCTGMLGSYDADGKVLTLAAYTLPKEPADYVNSEWKIQEKPCGGDTVNSYNDGPPAPGKKPMGPFYELESSSPAAALAPGESAVHTHRTIHLQGNEAELDRVAQATLGVSLKDIATAFEKK